MSAVPPAAPEALPGPEIDPSPAPDEAPASPSPEIPWPPPPAEEPAVPPDATPSPAPPEMPSPPPVHTPTPPPPTPITARVAGAWRAVAATCCGLALAGIANADTGVNAADRRFMAEATSSGMVEIVLGRLAQEKAVGEPARRLGQQMVDDHVKANEAMKALAAAKGVSLPTGLSAEEKASASHFKKMKGVSFDRTYVAKMVADHQKAVALFSQASSTAADPDVKSYAQATLPTLKSHLEMARQAAAVAVAAPKRGTSARE